MSGHLYAQFGEKEKHASRLITYIPEPKYLLTGRKRKWPEVYRNIRSYLLVELKS